MELEWSVYVLARELLRSPVHLLLSGIDLLQFFSATGRRRSKTTVGSQRVRDLWFEDV